MTSGELYWTMKTASSLHSLQRLLESPRAGDMPMERRLRDAKYHARKLIQHLGALEAAMINAKDGSSP